MDQLRTVFASGFPFHYLQPVVAALSIFSPFYSSIYTEANLETHATTLEPMPIIDVMVPQTIADTFYAGT